MRLYDWAPLLYFLSLNPSSTRYLVLDWWCLAIAWVRSTNQIWHISCLALALLAPWTERWSLSPILFEGDGINDLPKRPKEGQKVLHEGCRGNNEDLLSSPYLWMVSTPLTEHDHSPSWQGSIALLSRSPQAVAGKPLSTMPCVTQPGTLFVPSISNSISNWTSCETTPMPSIFGNDHV